MFFDDIVFPNLTRHHMIIQMTQSLKLGFLTRRCLGCPFSGGNCSKQHLNVRFISYMKYMHEITLDNPIVLNNFSLIERTLPMTFMKRWELTIFVSVTEQSTKSSKN